MLPIFTRKGLLLAKVETTEGEDAMPDASNAILVDVPDSPFSYEFNRIQPNEVGGSLDLSESIIGSMKAPFTCSILLRGADLPGMYPQWDTLMRACGWKRTQTATDVMDDTISVTDSNTIADAGTNLDPLTVGTVFHMSGWPEPYTANNGSFIVTATGVGTVDVTKPDGSSAGLVAAPAGDFITISYGIPGTSATAGSAYTATLATPFTNTAQAYRHMPLWLSGNPATPSLSFISDYTSGRVATLVNSYGTALSASTVASIPANVLYTPSSDYSNDIKTITLYYYEDGTVRKLTGCRGTVEMSFPTGDLCRMTFQFMGIPADPFKSDAAVPTVTNNPKYDPPKFLKAAMLADRSKIGVDTMSLKGNYQTTQPGDPNANEGYGVALITARRWEMEIDPLATLTATRNTIAELRAGKKKVMHARLGDTPGNRIAVTVPSAKNVALSEQAKDNLRREQITLECTGTDAATLGICLF